MYEPEPPEQHRHKLGPPVWWRGQHVVRVILGWHPCTCPTSRHGGHATTSCQKPGCAYTHYDPPHTAACPLCLDARNVCACHLLPSARSVDAPSACAGEPSIPCPECNPRLAPLVARGGCVQVVIHGRGAPAEPPKPRAYVTATGREARTDLPRPDR